MSEIIQGLSICDGLISLGIMSSRFIWVRLQMPSVNKSRMWQNPRRWAILPHTLCTGDRNQAKPRVRFPDESCQPGKASWNKGLIRGLLWCSSFLVKPAALVLSYSVIRFENCIVEVYLIEWKQLTQMMGMSQGPLVKSCLFPPSTQTGCL